MKKLLLLVLLPFFTLAQTQIIKINAGSATDQYFTGGTVYSAAKPIANTTEDGLYQTERFGNFSYSIPVTSGKYRVNLHFAEIYHTAANARLFDVLVENQQFTRTGIDIVALYGVATAGTITADNITVTDGFLTIAFVTGKDNAKISAITVDKYSDTTPTDSIPCDVCQTLVGPQGPAGPQGPQGEPGPQGPPGPSGSGGSGTVRRSEYSVYDYFAKGDGVNDDTGAFEAALFNAILNEGTLVIPPASGYFKITRQLNVVPTSGGQVWVDIKAKGRAGEIRYSGPSNTAVFKIYGLKGALWEGLNVAIEGGRTNVAIFDITADGSRESSSFNTFKTFYLNLGNGQDNIGIRTGYQNTGPKDISNYTFENMAVFGGGNFDNNVVTTIPGQYAFQNLGDNTLSMTWLGGFVANCDRAYSNITRDGSTRGNGSVAFYGLGGAKNNLDFYFAWEQAYIISGGRWENGNRFLKVGNGAYASVLLQGLVIHDYKQDNQIEISSAASVTLHGVQIAWTSPNKMYGNVILLNSEGRNAALTMEACGFTCNVPYTKTGSTLWEINMTGTTKMDGVWSNGFFSNEIGIRK